ncbi:P-loop containing nucleoside triphosphate hydrolase protein [Ephemerocybe angulata]|uniref:P-loop containing nucleoside triphosphate hydrolase protein n=1 Tax=Ephemerocybe angulata TaxID=980116 RepID=A0A8H6MFR2_9AGAR|nr:P-loop containing nucleoside triphosphate hydrolase protein [Tulosesus angulatus]
MITLLKPVSLVARGVAIRHLARRNVHTQPLEKDEEPLPDVIPPGIGLATPKELSNYLNQFVVGQERAKKVLSVAVYNHYNRVRANLEIADANAHGTQPDLESTPDYIDSSGAVFPAKLKPRRNIRPPSISMLAQRNTPLFEKSNVLVIGPTGSGKTLLAKTLAKVLDVPFSVSDATSFTQAGYVGEDVEMAVQRLLQAANWDPVRASMGIVYIDEVDKIARRTSSGSEGSRDVGGEGVQQALLRMMEGSIVTVQAKGAVHPAVPPGGEPSTPGQRAPQVAAKPETFHIDTSNVLFILSGAFVGLDNLIKQRVAKGSIGFTAAITSKDMPTPFFTPNNRKGPANLLDMVETTDLVKYGFIPEFIGRLPSITTLAPLTLQDLRRILTDVKGSLMSQYQALFGYSNVELRFTSGALDAICQKALERGGGARGLRGIMESLLLEPMYEVPGSDIRHVLITEEVVKNKASPSYYKRETSFDFWEAWATAEHSYEKGKTQ